MAREEVLFASESLGYGKSLKNILVENYLVSLSVFLVMVSSFFVLGNTTIFQVGVLVSSFLFNFYVVSDSVVVVRY